MKPLPRVIDPRKLAELGCELSGQILFSSDSRFADTLYALNDQAIDIDPVKADLRFWLDDQRRSRVDIAASVQLMLQCQRCNQPMQMPVYIESGIVVVRTEEQAKSVPRSLEYWQVPDLEADLYDLIEDEVLLSVPVIPKHDEGHCEAPGYDSGVTDRQSAEIERAENPFSSLKVMLKN